VHPHHERRKYLASPHGSPVLLTFEGFGRYGRAALARAQALAGAGFVPEPGSHERGFLSSAWRVDARPLPPVLDAAHVSHVARYLGWIARHEATGARADATALAIMLEANAREALGDAAARAAARLAAPMASTQAPAVRLDARMLRHEWIVDGGGLLKTDALHHHDDHFYPGPCDPAWDVAAAIIELDLDAEAAQQLLSEYRRTSGDDGLEERLAFHAAAYSAFRLGYTTLAADTLGDGDDGARFRREAARYRRRLETELARAAG
jgi:hypothetical protein